MNDRKERQKVAYRKYLSKCAKYSITLNPDTCADIIDLLDKAPNRTALICKALRLLDKQGDKPY